MKTKPASEWFARHLRAALTSLYDPSVLRNSPLAELLGVAQRDDTVSALRRTLIDAIESLRPNESTPRESRSWRAYQILRRRYTEQLTQRKVAADLGLSVRQLQREEKLAREMLAGHLWAMHGLEAKRHTLIPPPSQADDRASLMEARIPTRAQELEWLRKSVPVQMTEVGEVIQEVLETIAPLLEPLGVSVEYVAQENPPRIPLQVPMLQQALLNLVSTAICCVPGGQVRIQSQILSQQVCIHVRAAGLGDASFAQQPEYAESLEMAERLVHLCRGSLEITPSAGVERPVPSTVEGPVPSMVEGEVFAAKIALPAAEQVTVLVIDDNADALQLFQRYLSGSRYHFVGVQDARRALALAEELIPQIVVLDVMMPERDGWTLLGQFREHPKTRSVPIIVCTILPQEQLALTLGAAEFLRKPVSRTELLLALDRQLDRSPKGFC